MREEDSKAGAAGVLNFVTGMLVGLVMGSVGGVIWAVKVRRWARVSINKQPVQITRPILQQAQCSARIATGHGFQTGASLRFQYFIARPGLHKKQARPSSLATQAQLPSSGSKSGSRTPVRGPSALAGGQELKMVLCVNNSLGMGKGKIGEPTSPAAVTYHTSSGAVMIGSLDPQWCMTVTECRGMRASELWCRWS